MWSWVRFPAITIFHRFLFLPHEHRIIGSFISLNLMSTRTLQHTYMYTCIPLFTTLCRIALWSLSQVPEESRSPPIPCHYTCQRCSHSSLWKVTLPCLSVELLNIVTRHRHKNQILWDKVVKWISSKESRVRMETRRIAGEDLPVWKWIYQSGGPTTVATEVSNRHICNYTYMYM